MTKYYDMRTKRVSPNELKIPVSFYLVMILGSLILAFGFIHAFDGYIASQDRMLCHSAKISGNEEYLSKCQCFYEGKDISCIGEVK